MGKVVEHGTRIANARVLREPRGLKAGVHQFVHQRLERHAVLQANRDGKRESIHETRECEAFLRHLNEDFSRRSVIVHTYRQGPLRATDDNAERLATYVSTVQRQVRMGRLSVGAAKAGRATETSEALSTLFGLSAEGVLWLCFGRLGQM